MKIDILKEQLINETVSDDFKIFVHKQNDTFLVKQYISEICAIKHLTLNSISSIYEPSSSSVSLLFKLQDDLNVLVTDTFDERSDDYSQFNNIIVVCSKVDKSIQSLVSEYIFEFPELLDWQIEDYIRTICPGLDDQDAQWLCASSANNIDKVTTEIEKIKLFEPAEQHQILMELRFDPNSDLYQETIFNITDAIIKGDRLVLANFLKHAKSFNFDPIAINNIIFSTLKKIVLIKMNSGASASDIGVTQKQFNAFKNYLYTSVDADKIFKAMEFVSGIDLRLKSSELPLSRTKLFEYILCNTI